MIAHLLLHINWLLEKFEMLPKPNVILDGEQYLTFVNRTSWQSHTQQIHSLALTKLKNDTDIKKWDDLLHNSCLIKL